MDVHSYRFAVVYRKETREIAGATDIWRGWVERVPAPGERGSAGKESRRINFQDLSELPGLIRTLIEEARRDGGTNAD